jgi:hypothetical protein
MVIPNDSTNYETAAKSHAIIKMLFDLSFPKAILASNNCEPADSSKTANAFWEGKIIPASLARLM